jgi:hypothetical protein
VTSILAFSTSCSGCRLWTRVVALDTPTSPRVTDVGQVEFTVLPVPPEAAADAELLEPLELAGPEAAVVELELEQAATAVTVTMAAAASLVHEPMRGLSTYVPLSGSPTEPSGALFTWRNKAGRGT